jgi:hypothetical protein
MNSVFEGLWKPTARSFPHRLLVLVAAVLLATACQSPQRHDVNGGETLVASLVPFDPVEPTPKPSAARTSAGGDGEWRFVVAPYLWMADMRGASTVDGETAPLDVKFKDVLSDVSFGGAFIADARKDDWGIRIDASYMKLDGDEFVETPDADVDVDYEQTMGSYAAEFLYSPVQNLTLLAGVRYLRLDAEFDIDARIQTPGGRVRVRESVEETIDVLDPVIGAGVVTPLSDEWKLLLRGDFGGFGIGTDFSYQVNAMAEYLASENWSLAGGLRVIGFENIEEGDVKMDLRMFGLMLGAAFRF